MAVARTGSNLQNGKFIPTVFSTKAMAKFFGMSVVPAIANADWAGDIEKVGDTVVIRKIPDVTISDYTVNQTISPEDLSDDSFNMTVDRAKSYFFKVDDIDAFQSDMAVMSMVSERAALNAKTVIDKDVLASIYVDATTQLDNVVVSKANALETILQASEAMDTLNVPEEDRYIVIPPKWASRLKVSDLKNAYMTGDKVSPLRNGYIGEIDRFRVYVSNHLSVVGGQLMCYAGQRHALCFAGQFTKHETLRLQTTFADAARGLYVYGFKVTNPDSLVVIPATFSATISA